MKLGKRKSAFNNLKRFFEIWDQEDQLLDGKFYNEAYLEVGLYGRELFREV